MSDNFVYNPPSSEKALIAELIAELKIMVKRFELALILGGTTKELAVLSTASARAAIAKAEGK